MLQEDSLVGSVEDGRRLAEKLLSQEARIESLEASLDKIEAQIHEASRKIAEANERATLLPERVTEIQAAAYESGFRAGRDRGRSDGIWTVVGIILLGGGIAYAARNR